MIRYWSLILGPCFAVVLAISMDASGWDTKACWAGAIVTLCVVWWIFEPIPIPVTSIIPLAVFPLTGVLTKEDIARAYGDDMVLLMLGGFMISAALAHSGAHHRLALGLIRIVGGYSSRRIVFGFLCACAFISMWISNTATTLMMIPLALAVIDQSMLGLSTFSVKGGFQIAAGVTLDGAMRWLVQTAFGATGP
ncbi:MAG: hypothetical protein EBU46_20255, partial [Nitrosomonadaceae bacterium]|nr:hypothetical protein [Nitrosomonadaceae bacterium]